MKAVLVLAICAAVSLTRCEGADKQLENLRSSSEFGKYLLWGHALAAAHHDMTLGMRVNGDWLLNQQVINKTKSWIPFWRNTASYKYSVQQPGYITCVQVADKSASGTGGYATLVSGGPGYRNISLTFESQRNGPIDFIVSVYGYP